MEKLSTEQGWLQKAMYKQNVLNLKRDSPLVGKMITLRTLFALTTAFDLVLCSNGCKDFFLAW